MARTPPGGPHVVDGRLTQAVIDWILAGSRDSETSIGAVNSGVAEAKAAAAAAQATADGAKQDTADVVAETAPFYATISPFAASGIGKVNITTNAVTLIPNGGVGPYTYSWAYVSGDAFTVLSPTAATTEFRNLSTANGVYRGTITDSTPGTPLVATVNVGVSTIAIDI